MKRTEEEWEAQWITMSPSTTNVPISLFLARTSCIHESAHPCAQDQRWDRASPAMTMIESPSDLVRSRKGGPREDSLEHGGEPQTGEREQVGLQKESIWGLSNPDPGLKGEVWLGQLQSVTGVDIAH